MRVNASAPKPLLDGSMTAIAAAVATAASAALPPSRNTCNPAWAAKGWDVATTFRAKTGIRWEGYGKCQSRGGMRAECTVRWGEFRVQSLEFRGSALSFEVWRLEGLRVAWLIVAPCFGSSFILHLHPSSLCPNRVIIRCASGRRDASCGPGRLEALGPLS